MLLNSCHNPKHNNKTELARAQYMNFMKNNTNCYWEQSQQQQNIMVTTLAIVHPCLDVM